MLSIVPNKDRVLVKQLKDERKETEGGIILPTTVDREEKTQGTVIAVGEDIKHIKKGDVVFFGKYSGDAIKVREKDKDVEYVILQNEDILGWLNE